MLRRYCPLTTNNTPSLLLKCECLWKQIVVNWKAHSKHFVESWLRNLQNFNVLARGNEWLVNLVQDYVVGNQEYIKRAADMYGKCRLEWVDFHNRILAEAAAAARASARPIRSMRKN